MTTIRHVARQRMKDCTYQLDAMWVDVTNSVEEKESVNRMVNNCLTGSTDTLFNGY